MFDAKEYELEPKLDTSKSFYGKAKVTVYEDGSKILKCYGDRTLEFSDGKFYRLTDSDSISKTALRHAKDFVYQLTGSKDFSEDDFAKLPYKKEDNPTQILTLDIDKTELVATGTATVNGIETGFNYNFYDGIFSFTPTPEFTMADKDNKEAIKFIERDVLTDLFPTLGKDYIEKLLDQIGERYSFTNGLIQTEQIVSASDALLQMNSAASKDQVLRLYSGDVAVVQPKKDHFNKTIIYKTGTIGETKSYKTYSAVMREMPKHIQEIDKTEIEKSVNKVKQRDNRVMNSLIQEQAHER